MHQRVVAKFRIVAIIEGGGKGEPAVPLNSLPLKNLTDPIINVFYITYIHSKDASKSSCKISYCGNH